jgi:hypothetical protein
VAQSANGRSQDLSINTADRQRRLRHRPPVAPAAGPGAARPDLSESRGGLGANSRSLPLRWAGGPCRRLLSWASAGLLRVAGGVHRRSAPPLWSPQPVGRDLAAGVSFWATATACGPPAGPTRTRRSASVSHLRPPPGPGPWGRFASRSPPLRSATHHWQTRQTVKLRLGHCPTPPLSVSPCRRRPNKLDRPPGRPTVRGQTHPTGSARAGRRSIPCRQVCPLTGQARRMPTRTLGRPRRPAGARTGSVVQDSDLTPDGQSAVKVVCSCYPSSRPFTLGQARAGPCSLFPLQQEIK